MKNKEIKMKKVEIGKKFYLKKGTEYRWFNRDNKLITSMIDSDCELTTIEPKNKNWNYKLTNFKSTFFQYDKIEINIENKLFL